jgi:Ca2+-binding EF-hand superfamily protein
MAKRIIIASKNTHKPLSCHKLSISRYAFDTFDTNHDGSIDFEEFLLSISATSQGNIDDRLGVAFDL